MAKPKNISTITDETRATEIVENEVGQEIAEAPAEAEALVGIPTTQPEEASAAEALIGVPTNQPEANEDPIFAENLALKAENTLLNYKLEALQQAYDELAAIPGQQKTGQLSAKGSQADAPPTETFEVEGKLYRMNVKELAIRKLGKRTALDIISDDEPYSELGNLSIKEWLVQNNSSSLTQLSQP